MGPLRNAMPLPNKSVLDDFYPMDGRESWPNDAILYQPFEVEQVLLPDNSACTSVKAFLNMCKLPFTVQMKSNAEHMSPTGKVPFIRANDMIVAELENIVKFVNEKGITLTENLVEDQKCDMQSLICMVNKNFLNAELYVVWLDKVTYNQMTCPRYGCVYPWPLNLVLTWQKKKQVSKILSAAEWNYKSLENVYEEVDTVCRLLSEKLGRNRYFFNDRPTELDALVFGHLFNILTTTLPDGRLCAIVKKYNNLVNFCDLIDREVFGRPTSPSSKSSDENFEFPE